MEFRVYLFNKYNIFISQVLSLGLFKGQELPLKIIIFLHF